MVVADTGPPHYLVLIGVIDLLPKLFGRIVLPEIVRDELRHTRTPYVVRRWMADTPAWIEVATMPAISGVGAWYFQFTLPVAASNAVSHPFD